VVTFSGFGAVKLPWLGRTEYVGRSRGVGFSGSGVEATRARHFAVLMMARMVTK
jgi:hypothetical protein